MRYHLCDISCYASQPWSTGLAEGMFDFVEIKTVKAVQVRPIDRESHWNCDGELLPENHISIRAHRGLVQVCTPHQNRIFVTYVLLFFPFCSLFFTVVVHCGTCCGRACVCVVEPQRCDALSCHAVGHRQAFGLGPLLLADD